MLWLKNRLFYGNELISRPQYATRADLVLIRNFLDIDFVTHGNREMTPLLQSTTHRMDLRFPITCFSFGSVRSRTRNTIFFTLYLDRRLGHTLFKVQ